MHAARKGFQTRIATLPSRNSETARQNKIAFIRITSKVHRDPAKSHFTCKTQKGNYNWSLARKLT